MSKCFVSLLIHKKYGRNSPWEHLFSHSRRIWRHFLSSAGWRNEK